MKTFTKVFVVNRVLGNPNMSFEKILINPAESFFCLVNTITLESLWNPEKLYLKARAGSMKEQLLWFSKGSRERRLLTTGHSSPPGANDTASQPSGILPVLRHQPVPVINPAGMARRSQWPHSTSWGGHDRAANVHSSLFTQSVSFHLEMWHSLNVDVKVFPSSQV